MLTSEENVAETHFFYSTKTDKFPITPSRRDILCFSHAFSSYKIKRRHRMRHRHRNRQRYLRRQWHLGTAGIRRQDRSS